MTIRLLLGLGLGSGPGTLGPVVAGVKAVARAGAVGSSVMTANDDGLAEMMQGPELATPGPEQRPPGLGSGP